MSNVSLSSAVRANLLSLQETTSLINRTQGRLSTGLAIASPVDDAVKYFQAKSLSDRASDLAARKDGIDQGVSALTTALKATDAIEDLVGQMKGVVDGSRSGDKSQRASAAKQLRELAGQIQKLVDDSTYQGLNLLNSTASSLNVRFSEKADSKLEIKGNNLNASAFFKNSLGVSLGISKASAIVSELGFTKAISLYNLSLAGSLALFNKAADLAVTRLDKTISELRSKAATLAGNVAILNVRLDFTKQYVDVLEQGAGKLTLADLNEEGANLLALQTRQQLGIQALSFAGQAEQGILGLFR
ncbi:flagellin N-terminal helical domain-containing protein [Shumkonia mesophila]|uniref:flagellin N-terminal helical domain-containing protein n=1 Tax=Shumkonia mesophila TaxID=2838854 RepID=UPI0029347E8D|nr:flagellin [Shumkonia mesophila]